MLQSAYIFLLIKVSLEATCTFVELSSDDAKVVSSGFSFLLFDIGGHYVGGSTHSHMTDCGEVVQDGGEGYLISNPCYSSGPPNQVMDDKVLLLKKNVMKLKKGHEVK